MSKRVNNKQDILDAVNAANDALFYLEDAEKSLSKAKKWGIVDILGGKYIVTGIKREHMAQSNEKIAMAEGALDVLSKKLAALNQHFHLTYFNDTGAIDFLFDNFIMDLVTQSRINEVYKQVQESIAQVEGILDGLEKVLADQEMVE